MSKSDRLREMQEEINELKRQNENMRKVLDEYMRRDNPMIADCIKKVREK